MKRKLNGERISGKRKGGFVMVKGIRERDGGCSGKVRGRTRMVEAGKWSRGRVHTRPPAGESGNEGFSLC